MKASSISFQAAVLFVLVGMGWGLAMAVSHDHSTMPAHAHLNLLGWVSLFLFGLYYRLDPARDSRRLALAQVWVWIVGTAVLTAGVGLIHTGRGAGEPLAGAGSVTVLCAMILFAWIVFQGERANGFARAFRSLLLARPDRPEPSSR